MKLEDGYRGFIICLYNTKIVISMRSTTEQLDKLTYLTLYFLVKKKYLDLVKATGYKKADSIKDTYIFFGIKNSSNGQEDNKPGDLSYFICKELEDKGKRIEGDRRYNARLVKTKYMEFLMNDMHYTITCTNKFLDPLLYFLDCGTIKEFKLKYPSLIDRKKFRAHYFSLTENCPKDFNLELAIPAYSNEDKLYVELSGFAESFSQLVLKGEAVKSIDKNNNKQNWHASLVHGHLKAELLFPCKNGDLGSFLQKTDKLIIEQLCINSIGDISSLVCYPVADNCKETDHIKAKRVATLSRKHRKLEHAHYQTNTGELNYIFNSRFNKCLDIICDTDFRILNKVQKISKKGENMYAHSLLSVDDVCVSTLTNFIDKYIGFISSELQGKNNIVFRVYDKDSLLEQMAIINMEDILQKNDFVRGKFISFTASLGIEKFVMMKCEKEFTPSRLTQSQVEVSEDGDLIKLYHAIK
jgi:hypothetical protein